MICKTAMQSDGMVSISNALEYLIIGKPYDMRVILLVGRLVCGIGFHVPRYSFLHWLSMYKYDRLSTNPKHLSPECPFSELMLKIITDSKMSQFTCCMAFLASRLGRFRKSMTFAAPSRSLILFQVGCYASNCIHIIKCRLLSSRWSEMECTKTKQLLEFTYYCSGIFYVEFKACLSALFEVPSSPL